MAWTYSNWDSNDLGSAARTVARKAFLRELRDSLQTGSYTANDIGVTKDVVLGLLKITEARDKEEEAQEALASSTAKYLGFSRGAAPTW